MWLPNSQESSGVNNLKLLPRIVEKQTKKFDESTRSMIDDVSPQSSSPILHHPYESFVLVNWTEIANLYFKQTQYLACFKDFQSFFNIVLYFILLYSKDFKVSEYYAKTVCQQCIWHVWEANTIWSLAIGRNSDLIASVLRAEKWETGWDIPRRIPEKIINQIGRQATGCRKSDYIVDCVHTHA